MAQPEPTEVAPWYLRNITQALELNEATGQVFVRTNAALVGNVTVGNVAIGALGNVDISGNTMPVSGNITVVQGTDPWVITGNTSIVGNIAGITANVTVVDGGGSITVDGSVNANITGGNVTVTDNPAQLTAFEEPLAITITPVLQNDAVYGLDPDFWFKTQLNSGNVAVSTNNTWQVNSGTSAGGYARLATSRYMTYQPGQGSMFRWTAAFTTLGGSTKNSYGIDNIVQTTGPIDREDGYAVGFSGATDDDLHRKIGFLHRRNGKAELRTLTINTAPTGSQTATVTLNGTAYTVAITSGTAQYCAAQLAAGLRSQTAGQYWDIQACGTTVTFTYYSPGSQNGTYSLASSGSGTLAAGTFARTVAGSSPVDQWTYVDAWNGTVPAFDPNNLNVFALDFRWLGAGIVRLFMENPSTGRMVLVHTQIWSSTNTIPHIQKPSMRIVYRSGTTNPAVTPSQNVQVTGASIMAAIQGQIVQTGSSQSFYNLDGSTRAKDTVWHLLSIQNPYVRNGTVNKSSLVIQDMSVSLKSTDPAVIYMVKNSVGTSDLLLYQALPNASAFNFAQYSVTSVSETLSSDTLALVQTVNGNGSAQFNLLPYNLELAPGDTISAFISSTTSFNSSSIGITWKVD